MHRRLIVLLAAPLFTLAETEAQLLDFGSGAPAPGTGDWLLTDAARLNEEADRLESAGREGEAVPSAIAFRAALMRLAADLMERGEEMGSRGSEIALTGRTISARLADMDTLLRDLSTADPAGLETARAFAVRTTAAEPDTIEDVDRAMRAIMASLAQHAGERPGWAGWSIGPSEDEPLLDDLLSALEMDRPISKEAIESVRGYDAQLAEANALSAFEPAVHHTRELIIKACAVIELDERWLGAQREALIDQVDDALKGLSTDADLARTALLRLALLEELVRRSQAHVGSSASGRAMRDAVHAACAAPSSVDELDEAIRALRFSLRGLRQIEAGNLAPADDDVVRQLRPAMRIVQAERREAASRLVEAIPSILASKSARTDPGVLAALSGHAQARADIALLFRASTILTGTRPSPAPTPSAPGQPTQPIQPPTAPRSPGPVPIRGADPVASPTWQRFANVLLALGQDMTRPSTADVARARMRELCENLMSRVPLPAETEARGALADEFNQLTGGRGGELLLATGKAREEWLSRVEDEGVAIFESAARDEIDRYEQLMPVLLDAMDFYAHVNSALNARDGNRTCGRLSRIMAWELSSAAVLELAKASRDDLVRLTRLVLDNDHDWESEIQQSKGEHALLLTIGRLERFARTSQLPAFQPDMRGGGPPDAAVWELATGPIPLRTETTPLAELRPLLAELCRYTEEAYGRVPDPDPDERAAHAKYAAEVAVRVERATTDAFGWPWER